MPMFRKKPVVIEAVQLTWSNWSEICAFVPQSAFVRGVWLDEEGKPTSPHSPEDRPGETPGETPRWGKDNSDLGLLLSTLEGEMLARGNDWIIKGVNGEVYVFSKISGLHGYEPEETQK
jgi:hypothetical protein